MHPKSQSSGNVQQPHGGNQSMPMRYNSPHAHHHFHQHDPNVDGATGGANMPAPHRQHQQYPQGPLPNAGGGKRGGGGSQQQPPQHQQPPPPQQGGYGGGYQDYPPYGGGGNNMHYSGGSNDYRGAQVPQSGNSSTNASVTRRSTGSPGLNNNNMHHQHHVQNQQGMLPIPPHQQGGGYYAGSGGPMAPPGMNPNHSAAYGMDQGGAYHNPQMGARDGSGSGGNPYGGGSGVTSPNPPPAGPGYMPPPVQKNPQGPRRGGGGGGYNNGSGMGQQPLPPPMQPQPQPQPQRYGGAGGNNNSMYRDSPYPAPGTPHHHHQVPPQQHQQQNPPLSMPPQQPHPQGGANNGGGWSPNMMGPPPSQQNTMGAPMPMHQGGAGNYGYNNNAPPPQQRHQPQQMSPQSMYHGQPSDAPPPGTYGGPYGGVGGGAGPYGGGNSGAAYGQHYDGPGPGMPSMIVPPPVTDPSASGMPMHMNARGRRPPPASHAQSLQPLIAPGGYAPNGGMVVGGGGDQRASVPPQDVRNTPAAADGTGGLPLPQPPQTPLEKQKDLYGFLHDRRLLKKRALHEFFPANYDAKRQGPLSIAVDGNYLLSTLRARMCSTIDSLWFLHSSLPDCLTALVNTEVQRMRQHNLEPVWVFQGIGLSGDVEAFLPTYDELRKRAHVWNTLMCGQFPEKSRITEAFVNAATMGEDVIMAVQRFLRSELNVLTVTAPFSHWCQMCTLHHEGDVQLLYGHPEMLMVPYGPMELLVEIDFDTASVAYFDRNEVLNNLFPDYVVDGDSSSASDRLLDLGILVATHSVMTAARAGICCSLDQIYSELSSTTPQFRTLAEFITAFEDGQPESRRGNEALKHSKGRAYIRYSAVFTKQFKESPLTYFSRVLDPALDSLHTPGNLSGVFGNHLPLCLFFFQYAGLVSVSFMTIITQLYCRDDPPASDSLDYQDCLPKLMALRSQIVFQVVPKLDNKAYQQRLGCLSWVRWFHRVLILVQRPPSAITLDEWKLESSSGAAIASGAEGETRAATSATDDEGPENVTMAMALNTSATCFPTSSVEEKRVLYHGRHQTVQAILLKSLDFLGYYSHKPPVPSEEENGSELEDNATRRDENGEPLPPRTDDEPGGLSDSSDGSSFTKYLRVSLLACDAEFQSALVRFTELLRVSVLNAAPPRYVPIPIEGSTNEFEAVYDIEHDDPPIRLASRIACLLTVPYLEECNTGPDDSPDRPAMSLDDAYILKWAPVYSRSLCAFFTMARAMNRDLRELVEVITVSLFLQELSDCTLEEFASFTPLLPFGDALSAIGGLLLHYVLVFPDDYEDGRTTMQSRCELLHERFTAIRDITTQLRRVMEFTFHALCLLNAYLQGGVVGITAEGLSVELVVETLDLLAHKWRLHLADPVPEDVHQLWGTA